MSDLVERLAAKRSGKAANELSIRATRWWLNAIADELDEQVGPKTPDSTPEYLAVTSWLRSQASDSGESE